MFDLKWLPSAYFLGSELEF